MSGSRTLGKYKSGLHAIIRMVNSLLKDYISGKNYQNSHPMPEIPKPQTFEEQLLPLIKILSEFLPTTSTTNNSDAKNTGIEPLNLSVTKETQFVDCLDNVINAHASLSDKTKLQEKLQHQRTKINPLWLAAATDLEESQNAWHH